MDNLPREIRCLIFYLLEKKERKICRLVNSKWKDEINHVIGLSVIISDVYRGNIKFAEKVKILEAHIISLQKRNADRLRWNTAPIHRIAISSFIDNHYFKRHLSQLPNLTTLLLKGSVLYQQEFYKNEEILSFLTLKEMEIELRINSSDLPMSYDKFIGFTKNLKYILSSFNCPRLEVFKYNDCVRLIVLSQNWTDSPLRKFIETNGATLRKVKINGFISDKKVENKKKLAQLDTLEVQICTTEDENQSPTVSYYKSLLLNQSHLVNVSLCLLNVSWDWETVAHIMTNNNRSLKHVHICFGWTNISTPMDLSLMSECSNLKHISIGLHAGSEMLTEAVNLTNLPSSLQVLKLHSLLVATEEIKQIQQLFPDMKELSLQATGVAGPYGVNLDVLTQLANMPSLKNLKISQFNPPQSLEIQSMLHTVQNKEGLDIGLWAEETVDHNMTYLVDN